MIFNEINELRKAGELQRAREMAVAELERHPGDVWASKALFWVLRDMAVQAADCGNEALATQLADQMAVLLQQFSDPDGIAAKALNALREHKGWEIYHQLKDGMGQMPLHDVRQVLFNYLQLPVARPSMLHSMIMGMAVQAAKLHEEFNFAEFMTRWGTDCFTEADWERRRGDKVTFPSLVERVVTRYIAAARRHHVAWSAPFMALLEQAVERFPDKDQLRRHYAQALHQQGRTQEAMDIYRRLLLTLDTFYAWHELAHLTADPALHRAALCRAVLAPGTDDFKVNLHLELGILLAEQGRAAEALALLNAFRQARADKPLHELPGDWFIATNRIPDGTQPAANLRTALQPLAEPADEWLYAAVQPVPALVAGRYTNKHGKPTVSLVVPDGSRLSVPARRVPREAQHLLVRLAEVEGRKKVVNLALATPEQVTPAFADMAVTGPARLRTNAKGQPFAFVQDVYVSAEMLQGVTDGQQLAVVAETTAEGRRRAIARL
ncbi:MAG: tetratricopeptide repeat protein [Muribaculaceae bacterium]|nr:tetratricopeptide repeat protein [Muribaculaceae bacterium]